MSRLPGDSDSASYRLRTGFVFHSQTRPSPPTESSSRCLPAKGDVCYGLAVHLPLLSTPGCPGAVTVGCLTVRHRKGADFHHSDYAPFQAHERGIHAAST